MKKLFVLLLAALLVMTGSAFAGGLGGLNGAGGGSDLKDLLSGVLNAAKQSDLPDPKVLLPGGALVYEDSFALDDGARGVAYAYPMPEQWDSFLQSYTALCEAAGYTVETGTQLRQPAWKVESNGRCAWLIPEFKGCLLMVVDRDIPFAPVPTPEPTATPRPTTVPRVTTAPSTGGGSSGHWEYISVQQDCFACVGGVCDLCNGSGWYRAYGEQVPCSRYCKTCDGLGWWESTRSVWVYD